MSLNFPAFFFHLIHFPSKFFCFHISAHVSFLMPPWRWPSPWRWPLQLTCLAWSKASRELFISSTGPRMFLVNLHSLQKGSWPNSWGVIYVVQLPRAKGGCNWAILGIVSSMYALWKPAMEPLGDIVFVPFGSGDDEIHRKLSIFL